MFANSPAIRSTQLAPHPRLREIVERHRRTLFRRPIAAASVEAFAILAAWRANDRRALILDSGCGTGASTLALARQHPHCAVLGIDKSALRLAQGLRQLALPDAPANALLARCDLVDFWRLAAQAGWKVARHYLLYPNPWPKPEHLQRRWHAHAVLPSLLVLGGALELRCNWAVYAEEFADALACFGIATAPESFIPDTPLTPFERKYQASAHALWRCRATLSDVGAITAGAASACAAAE